MPLDLNETTGAALGDQLWVGQRGRDHLTREAFTPVKPNTHPTWKPREGGLWTSTWNPDIGSGWVQWCLGEQYDGPTWKHACLLEPEPDARLLVVDSYKDLEAIYKRWPHDFEEREGVR